MNPMEGGEKHLQESPMQTVAQNLTSESAIQSTQNVIQSNVHNVQTMIGSSTQIMGKSVSLDLSPKLSIRKPVVSTTVASLAETNKMPTTICPVGSTVRIISPTMLHTVERQASQQSTAQQIVTNIAPTYHVPRGPAAVANISAPRAALATPIVRSSTSHSVHVSRPGANPSVATQQWQSKTSATYVPPQRYPVPSVSRVAARTPATVYSGSQQPRLTTPSTQGRPLQTAVVSGIPGAPSRLIAPVLQTNSNVARVSITQAKSAVPQANTVQQVTAQPARLQNVQSNQVNKPQNNLSFTNRVAVSAPVISSANKIVTVTSIQTTVTRQLSINTVPGTCSTANVSRIVIPHCQAQSQPTTARVVQAVTSLSNFAAVPRTVTTTANVGSVARVVPTTGVARITSMPLHSLPIPAMTRTLAAPIKIAQTQNISHTMQIKPSVQQVIPKTTVSGVSTSTNSAQPIQGQYLPPTTTTYYSLDPSGNYSQFRQATVQPVRLTIVDTGYEESHNKANSSPRPSILRKRDHDGSPAKSNVAKNLVPILSCMSSNAPPPISSPPASPGGDGCQSSGSTTVSATSSPGLDEPEQSRIPMNTNIEMSPRKKPRKQQLSSVELTESRCTDEEMQFIVEEKVKKEPMEEMRDTKADKKLQFSSQEDIKQSSNLGGVSQSTPIRTRPIPSLLGSSYWKNTYNGRHNHYRRPSEVRPQKERKPSVAEIAQQKYVLQKLNGWKIHHLTSQMDDLAELEKQVHEKLKTTLNFLENQQQNLKNQDDSLERVNELIKGNMQRSNLISEGMSDAHKQLFAIFQHKKHVSNILQRCSNKRSQKKRDK